MDSVTHMHDLVFYVKVRLLLAQDLSLENPWESYLFFQLTLLYSLSYFFLYHQLPPLSLEF